MLFTKIQSVAKFLVALIGTLITAGTTFIPAEYGPWLGFAAAILTAVATYAVPNTSAPAQTSTQGADGR